VVEKKDKSKIKLLYLETFVTFAKKLMRYFQTRFLEEADEFIAELDTKTARKVFYNIDLAEQTNDPKLFKKLHDDIWEFRTKYSGLQIRLLAFWDKKDKKETLVIASLGFIKKTDKVPKNEIERAMKIRANYFGISK
jgi:phage-related protein